MSQLIDWLLLGEPWVEYRTRLDLLGQAKDDPRVIKSRQAMITHPQIQSLLKELSEWPGTVLNSHKSASQSFHKLSFLADLGFKITDPGVKEIVDKILAHQSDEGPFQLPMNISENYGGTGKDQWAWALCDAPVVLYALVKFGLGDDERVKIGISHLVGLIRENGWPCAVSKELGKFRGPGRKDDPCPYANLAMLKTLAQFQEWNECRETRIATNSLLDLWERSLELHPYMFYMGTDFRKLKAPLIWYDILHVTEVLSQFSWLKGDPRLQEMVELMKQKAAGDGLYTPESIYKPWSDWDFGQKKKPSQWITFLVLRISKRLEPKPNSIV